MADALAFEAFNNDFREADMMSDRLFALSARRGTGGDANANAGHPATANRNSFIMASRAACACACAFILSSLLSAFTFLRACAAHNTAQCARCNSGYYKFGVTCAACRPTSSSSPFTPAGAC